MSSLATMFRRRTSDSDVEKELRFHIEQQIEDYVRAGMSREEAARRTRLEFGGLQQVREECRDVFIVRWFDDLVRDVRLAIRGFRRSPVFFWVAVVTLALAIGANTAIFSLIDAVLLRNLPVKDPERLVALFDQAAPESDGMASYDWSFPVVEQLEQHSGLFEGIAAWSTRQFNLATGGQTSFVTGSFVNGSYFETLGVPPLLGRTFSNLDDRRGGGPDGAVAVISYGFWQRQFGGAASVIGRTLTLDGVPFTVIGVTPPDFVGGEVGRALDLFVPFGDEPLLYGRESRLGEANRSWIFVTARLKPGDTLSAATASLRGIQPQIREATIPASWTAAQRDRYLRVPFTLVPAATGVSGLRRRYERPLMTLMIIVGLVLLVACANVANLMLARATARSHEMSARLALGGSRARLVRQVLTESALLSMAGTAMGVLFALWGCWFLVDQLSNPINPVFLDLSIDRRALAYTIAITAGTALLFGVAPALLASHASPVGVLKDDARSSSGGAKLRLVSWLVVAQVALSLALVVAAGLFVRTFVSLAGHEMGFRPDGVLVVDVNAQHVAADPAHRVSLFEQSRRSVRALPGVAAAGVSYMSPVRGERLGNLIQQVSGGSVPASDQQRIAMMNLVSPDWFDALGMRLVAGRDFTDADRVGAPPVAVVNQAFGRRFLGGASPLGHTITAGVEKSQPSAIEIVGVTEDAVYSSLRDDALATMYFPLAQHQDFESLAVVRLSVRSSVVPPALLTRSVAEAIGGVNPQLALTFRPLAEQVNASITQERVVAILSGFFGVLALLLAGLGLYGVTSYGVSQRRAEIGIRMALGAEPGGILRLVLSRVSMLVGIGVAIGAVFSMWASSFVASLLYDLKPRDPVTLISASLVLLAVGLLAGWLPARRAARLDPAVTLRSE